MANPPNAVHHSAEQGYTPAAADLYVRGRPDYPPEVNAWLRDTLGLGSGTTVVDLGAGTGKFTRRLLETGARVLAVEPVAAMRAKLAATLPEVDTRAGTAESLPLDDASVDAVVCAQAFHWFANAASLAEILRVLKPGGRLGLIWNLRDASVQWVARMDAIVNRAEGDTPRYYTGQWRSAFPFAGFGPLHEQRFVQGHTGPPEDVIIARVKSTSFIAALPREEQAGIEAELRALIDSEPQLRGKALVTVPYGTAAFHCIKQS